MPLPINRDHILVRLAELYGAKLEVRLAESKSPTSQDAYWYSCERQYKDKSGKHRSEDAAKYYLVVVCDWSNADIDRALTAQE